MSECFYFGCICANANGVPYHYLKIQYEYFSLNFNGFTAYNTQPTTIKYRNKFHFNKIGKALCVVFRLACQATERRCIIAKYLSVCNKYFYKNFFSFFVFSCAFGNVVTTIFTYYVYA